MLQSIHHGYRITKLITTTSMGSLYRAESVSDTSQKVLVQLIEKKYFLSPSVAAQYAAWVDALKKLKHPYLLECIDYWSETDFHGVVYAEADGTCLQNLLQDVGYLWDKDQIDKLVADLLSLLQFLADRGFIHQQINPRFLLYDINSQQLRLYGLFFNSTAWASYVTTLPIELLTEEVTGVIAQGSDTLSAEQLEMMNYIPPEQVEGLPLNTASDIYSTGVLFFRLVRRRCLTITSPRSLNMPIRCEDIRSLTD